MLKQLLFSVILLSTFMMVGQNNWKKSSIDAKDNVVFVESHIPSQYQLFNLNLNEVKTELQAIDKRENVSLQNATTVMSFPDENGKMQRFKMLEDSVMEDELAAQFPMIKTYIGQGIDDPTATLRMSIGTDGVHVMVLAANKSPLLIDPYTQDRSKYIVYSANKLPAKNDFVCEVLDDVHTQTTPAAGFKNAVDGKMRQYRLAVACTIEYSAYHLANQGVPASATLATKKAAVLSAIVNTINRVTGVYEKETAVKFVLVGNNSNIIFIVTDNFSNTNPTVLIAESQTQITNIIGTSNFDVGHTFSTGGGGLASLGSICYFNAKARGITGSAAPIGDFYDIDYVAHEIGHQFGANHTFNGTTGSCAGNGATGTSAEPGSGSTIMAYAGICSGQNVQGNSDAYFHYYSLQEIYARITSAPSCAAITNTGNNEPTANAGPNYTIPKGTAFILEGQAADIDGDAITYCWEQTDTATNPIPLASTSTAGPTYRSLLPTTAPNRFMPAFATVVGGSLASTWEVTPTVGRTLNFVLTTRDNRADGGQSKSDATQITVNGTAGPFAVTSQTATETWATGETKTITWDVAGTTANGINATVVDIMLVGDDGAVLSTLVSNTVNDGSESITVPNITSNTTKVMVKASNNIFYAINSGVIGVNANANCTSTCDSTGRTQYPDGTTLVQFNTINNPSTGASAYSDYTAISTTLVRGTAYNLTVNVNTDGNFKEETIVWIDWNRDCVFNTTDEQYLLGENTNVTNSPTSLSPLSITVPNTASEGSMIMRVSSAYIGGLQGGGTTTLPESCDTGFIGEVEDYTIIVTAGAATDDIANFDYFNLSPNPNNGNFSIALKSDNVNDITVKVFDIIGRQVFDRSYENNQSIFNKEIRLNNVQSGVYLVSITDGVRYNTEKIIIK